jgi:hypothetical protein
LWRTRRAVAVKIVDHFIVIATSRPGLDSADIA